MPTATNPLSTMTEYDRAVGRLQRGSPMDPKFKLPEHLTKYQCLIIWPVASEQDSWANDRVLDLVNHLRGMSFNSIQARTKLDAMLTLPAEALQQAVSQAYKASQLAPSVKAFSKFALFLLNMQDEHYGVNLPVAVLYRLDDKHMETLQKTADLVKDGVLTSALIKADPSDVRWLSKVAFSTDDVLSAVPRFFDPQKDEVVCFDDIEEFTANEQNVVAGDACVVYAHTELRTSDLLLSGDSGRVYVSANGTTTVKRDVYNLESLQTDWETFKSDVGYQREDPVAAEAVSFDRYDKATLLASLVHYAETNQGDPCNRSEAVQAVAIGRSLNLTSLDASGIQGLIEKVCGLPDDWEMPRAPADWTMEVLSLGHQIQRSNQTTDVPRGT